MPVTNFPRAGDNKAVSLRNSSYARFPLAGMDALRSDALWSLGKPHTLCEVVARVCRQGGVPKTRAEEKAVRLREAWAEKHYRDKRLPGVVAQIQRLVVGELGENGMNALIAAAKEDHGPAGQDTGREAQAANRGASARDQHPEPRGASDEDHARVFVRSADVRSVRRETRPNPATGATREVVVVEFVASTEVEDSHESIVKSNWDLTRFLANPVLIWMHGRQNDLPAIGNVEGLHREGTMHIGHAVFDDTTEFDRDVAAKYEKGVLRGFSIGFYPRTVRFETKEGRDILILDDIELLEISCVNVPSNPESLAREQRQYEALREQARAAREASTRNVTAPALPAPPITTTSGTAAPTGDRNIMHSIIIEERDVQLRDKGATCDVTCPGCKEKIGATLTFDTTKSAAYAEQSTRLAATESKLTAAERLAAERETALNASLARNAEFEKSVNALTAQVVSTRVKAAETALTARSGEKLFPNEVAHELAIARGYLADLTPDPEAPKEDPTRTIGEKRWAERLSVLDARPSLRLLGAPVTTTTTPGSGTAPQDNGVRAIVDPADPTAQPGSTGGEGLAALVSASPTA